MTQPIASPGQLIPDPSEIPVDIPLPHLSGQPEESDLPRLGWIGFGSMGQAMAGRLLDAGIGLAAFNRNPEKIPQHPNLAIRTSPGEVAREVRILFLMVTDGTASNALLSGPDGILSGLCPGTIVINMSTIAPHEALLESRMIEEAGGRYLDIPVSGSVIPAIKGELLLLAGGRESDLALLQPYLSILGKETLHLGPQGSGMIGKLVINALLAAQMKALSQTVALGEVLGFGRGQVLDLVLKSPLSCAFYQLKKENLSSRIYPKAFSAALMEKDLALALSECLERSIDSSFVEEIAPPYRKALESGWGESDLSVIFELLRKTDH